MLQVPLDYIAVDISQAIAGTSSARTRAYPLQNPLSISATNTYEPSVRLLDLPELHVTILACRIEQQSRGLPHAHLLLKVECFGSRSISLLYVSAKLIPPHAGEPGE